MKTVKGKLKTTMVLVLVVSMILGGCGNHKDTPVAESESVIVTESETHNHEEITVTESGTGNQAEITITEPGTVLENVEVDKIIIAKEVGEGDVTLKNVDVDVLEVYGGGSNSVHVISSEANTVVFLKIGEIVRFVVEEGTQIGTMDATNTRVEIQEGAKVWEIAAGEDSQIVVEEGGEAEAITLEAQTAKADLAGTVSAVRVLQQNVEVNITASAAIEELHVEDGAARTKLNILGLVNTMRIAAANTEILIEEDATVSSLRIEHNAEDVVLNVNGNVSNMELLSSVSVAGTGEVNRVETLVKELLQITGNSTIIENAEVVENEYLAVGGVPNNPEPTPSAEPSAEPTPSPEPSAEPTPTPSPEAPAEPTPSPESPAEPTPSPSPEPSAEPTPTPSPENPAEPSHEHKFTVLLEKVDATCIKQGYSRYQCQECTDTEDVVIEMIAHQYTDGKCSTCGICKEHMFELTDDKLVGDTCEGGIINIYTCTECGFEKEEEGNTHNLLVRKTIDVGTLGNCNKTMILKSCACGYTSRVSYKGGDKCQYPQVPLDPETGMAEMACLTCGFPRTVSVEIIVTECEDIAVQTFIYYDLEGNELGVDRRSSVTSKHNFNKFEFEMLGDTCEDGYYVTQTCGKCGTEIKIDNLFTDHENVWTVSEIDVGALGSCNETMIVKSCACGYTSEVSYDGGGKCQYPQIPIDPVTGKAEVPCEVCGFGFIYSEENVGSECDSARISTYVYHDPEGNVLGIGRRTYPTAKHDFQYEFEMLGDACEDGYYVTQTCRKCGFTYKIENPFKEHRTWVMSEEEILSEGWCGTWIKRIAVCPCGQDIRESAAQIDGNCSFEDKGYVDGYRTYVCSKCEGMYYSLPTVWEAVEGTTCAEWIKSKTIYTMKGQDIFECNERVTNPSHDYYSEFELQGDSCADGYYQNQVCKTCGAVEEGTYLYTEHQKYVVYEDVAGAGDWCYKLQKGFFTCPCGQEKDAEPSYSQHGGECNFALTESKDDVEVYTCSDCGGVKTLSVTKKLVEGTTCEYKNIRHLAYMRDGVEVCGYDMTLENEFIHDYKWEYVALGDSCEDGVYQQEKCVGCGDIRSTGATYTTHELSWDSKTVADDWCFPWIQTEESCFCKQKYRKYYFQENGNCSFEQTGNENGVTTYTCSTCGGVKEVSRTETLVEGSTCEYEIMEHYSFSKNGVEVFSYDETNNSFIHDYENIYELLGTSCEEGYYRHLKCKKCNETDTSNKSVYTTHDISCKSEVFSEDWCYPWIQYETYCPCKQNYKKYYVQEGGQCNFEVTDNVDGASIWTCSVCNGVQKVSDTETLISETTCEYEQIRNYVFSKDGAESFSYSDDAHNVFIHDYENIYELLGTSCEEGYYCRLKCQKCGAIETNDENRYTAHNTYVYQEDLVYDASGTSLCSDITMVYAKCPCGVEAHQYVSVNCEHNADNGYTCPTCGLIRADYSGYIAEEPNRVYRLYIKYILNGVEIAVVDTTWNE